MLLALIHFYPCISFIKSLAKELVIEEELKVVKSDVKKYILKCNSSFDLIFCDPPYDYRYYIELTDLIFKKNLLNPSGLLIMEHDKNIDFKNHVHFESTRKYGTSRFSFLKY